MICRYCQQQVKGSATVCPHCGKSLMGGEERDAFSLRQGRSPRTEGHTEGSVREKRYDPLLPDPPISTERRPRAQKHGRSVLDAGKPDSRRGLISENAQDARVLRGRDDKKVRVYKSNVNWTLLALILIVLFLFAVLGGFMYLKMTDQGQLILARMGQEVNANALWALGTEYLDQGYIERSINAYETALAQEPERDDLYDKLLLLSEAYEAGGYYDKAEDVYIRLYSEIDEADITAYNARIRLLRDQQRYPELADFLKYAYEKTEYSDYRKQREELLPSAPTVKEPGNTYRLEDATYKEIHLESAEGYDIYYLINGDENDTLPESGTLYTEDAPIRLYEGGHKLRAVAVSSELVSDEMTATYSIALQVPEAPKCSLAPDTYKTKQRVYLRYPDEKNADKVTIYYTIDGQSPTANSPIYTGEPVQLPVGRVTIKAVAVNEYGKVSNEMSVEVKIDQPIRQRFFNENDTFGGFTVLTTTHEQFIKKYGEPLEEAEITDVMPGTCLKLSYNWGECRFYMTEKGYVLYALETSSASMGGPRSTKVGSRLDDVVAQYRDMGQTYDQNGDRSIYWDKSAGYAKLYKLDDESGRIDYVYYTADGGSMILSYTLHSNLVVRIGMRYEP
ncbi:MAG: hypothetical protein E7326_02950 [Clostridiales bacterium]|nr:hypothetical protein [Clostridiales bacterium]